MKAILTQIFLGKNVLINGVIALSIVGLIALGCACPPPSNRTSTEVVNDSGSTTPSPNSSASNVTRDGRPELELVKAKWSKGGFGAIGIWKVTIKNNSDKKLGDIKFRTVYFSETGNIVSKGGVDGLLGKDTIEKIVPPKSSRTFEVNDGFIGDEAQTAEFSLVSWREIP